MPSEEIYMLCIYAVDRKRTMHWMLSNSLTETSSAVLRMQWDLVSHASWRMSQKNLTQPWSPSFYNRPSSRRAVQWSSWETLSFPTTMTLSFTSLLNFPIRTTHLKCPPKCHLSTLPFLLGRLDVTPLYPFTTLHKLSTPFLSYMLHFLSVKTKVMTTPFSLSTSH